MKFSSLIKPVSLLLVACLMTESTLGSLAESNIWKERQKANQAEKKLIERPTQLASLPLQLPEISRNAGSLEFLAHLPANLGSIRKISAPKNKTTKRTVI